MTERVGHERGNDAELEQVYLSDRRDAPWLYVNMVTTIDGGTSVDGRSSSIGDSQDLAVFRVLRSVADLVLVAASTVRSEEYKKPKLPEHLMNARRDRGQSELPRIAIVTTSLEFDIEPFADAPPIVLTSEDSPRDIRESLAERTDVIVCGTDGVDLTLAVSKLREMGFGRILGEGGPTLNGQLAQEDLIDEFCLTIAPLVVSGDSKRIVASQDPISGGQGYRLDRAIAGDSSVFTRWIRERS